MHAFQFNNNNKLTMSFLKCNVNIEISIDIIKDISNACMEWSVVQLNANATIINEIFSDTIFFGECPGIPWLPLRDATACTCWHDNEVG
jgi:hypothetical protein